MAANTNCPTLKDFIIGDSCSENFGGMGTTVYVFKRKDLVANAFTLAKVDGVTQAATYTLAASPFGSDGKLWKFECKRESQEVKGESQGYRKGFIITATFVIEAVSEDASVIARALNTGDLGFILLDSNGKYQLLYDDTQRCEIESGGLTTDTGAAATDDRQMTVNVKLGPVSYPNLFLSAAKADLEKLVKETNSSSTTTTS